MSSLHTYIAWAAFLLSPSISWAQNKPKQWVHPEIPSEVPARLEPSRWVSPAAMKGPFAQPAQTIKIGTLQNRMEYDRKSVSTKKGAVIKIVFKNNSDPAADMEHNLVVIEPGSVARVVQQGLSAGTLSGFVPNSKDIVAAIFPISGGSEGEVVFRAPSKPGAYPIVCTVPGHGSKMKSVLIVK